MSSLNNSIMTRDLFLIKHDGRRDQTHLYLWFCARESAKIKGGGVLRWGSGKLWWSWTPHFETVVMNMHILICCAMLLHKQALHTNKHINMYNVSIWIDP
jgi:hypothetical protein